MNTQQFDPNNDNRQTLPRFTPEAMRANMRIVNILQQFGRTRGMTSSQDRKSTRLNSSHIH